MFMTVKCVSVWIYFFLPFVSFPIFPNSVFCCFCSKDIINSISWQLDCGIHPGLEGMDALPYIDLIDPAEIDLLLISQ